MTCKDFIIDYTNVSQQLVQGKFLSAQKSFTAKSHFLFQTVRKRLIIIKTKALHCGFFE
jgi:formyltetrahydrofolate hydrolase